MGDAMEEFEPGEFRLRDQPARMACTYTLRAERR
jgi:hypothetical protein